MRKSWDSRFLRWAMLAAWMGVIFLLSAQPTLPDLTGGRFPGLESIAGHFTVFFVLALLWRSALISKGVRHAALWAFVIAVLYGASDEFHQHFVPNRNPNIFDLAVDAIGAAVAISVATWVRARQRPAVASPGKPSE